VRSADSPRRAVELHLHPVARVSADEKKNVVFGFSLHIGSAGLPIAARGVRRRRGRHDLPADVFDEGDRFVVIAELPGIDASAVHWNLRDGRRLTVRGGTPGRERVTEIDLSARVDEQTVVSRFENGVLELQLWKTR
jgi:hypothetical protein